MADRLRTFGYEKNTTVLPTTGETSVKATAGLDCSVVEIAKSIIFRRVENDAPVLVIASSTNCVDEAKISAHMDTFAKADVKFVREKAGYVIGGVCPAGHAIKPAMLLDQDLFQYDSLWTTADHPRTVFNLTPAELEATVGTSVAGIAQRD